MLDVEAEVVVELGGRVEDIAGHQLGLDAGGLFEITGGHHVAQGLDRQTQVEPSRALGDQVLVAPHDGHYLVATKTNGAGGGAVR